MQMIKEAAEVASEVYKTHWLHHWTKAHYMRFTRCTTTWGRRMAEAGLFNDIESVMKDVPQHEHP